VQYIQTQRNVNERNLSYKLYPSAEMTGVLVVCGQSDEVRQGKIVPVLN
jgi:hypothetical protein